MSDTSTTMSCWTALHERRSAASQHCLARGGDLRRASGTRGAAVTRLKPCRTPLLRDKARIWRWGLWPRQYAASEHS